jgi:hypothetical protein
MDYHKNAPWTAISRERLARMVISDGITLSSAAARFSVSAKTAARRWDHPTASRRADWSRSTQLAEFSKLRMCGATLILSTSLGKQFLRRSPGSPIKMSLLGKCPGLFNILLPC